MTFIRVKGTLKETLTTTVTTTLTTTVTTHNIRIIRNIKKRIRAKFPPSETMTREKHKKMTYTPY